MKISLTSQLSKVLNRICDFGLFIAKTDLTILPQIILEFYDKLEQNCGSRFAINELKAIYNEVSRYALDGIVEKPLTQMIWKRNKQGFIRRLHQIQKLMDNSNVDQKRMILTMLRSYETLQVDPILDLTTITTPSEGETNYATFREDFVKFLENSVVSQTMKQDFISSMKHQVEANGNDFHYTTKKGIKGSTIGNAGIQSLAIIGKFKDTLVNFASIFSDKFEEVLRYNRFLYVTKKEDLDGTKFDPKDILFKYHVKVVAIPDKGTKTRIIAIGNYWLQQALKPLHRILYEVLRHVSTDGTHNQNSQFSRVQEASKYGPVWSFDLTAATDRFPRGPQIDVLKYMYQKVGILWEDLLNQVKCVAGKKEVVYQVGQPMGLYTSWATFTLTHHLLIQYCSSKAGNTGFFEQYAIIGDDVSIWDRAVAELYVHYIQLLGVQINWAKSFIPRSFKGPCNVEFAKRICQAGVEYSGVSPGIIMENYSIWEIPELLNFLAEHNFTVAISSLTEADILKYLKIKIDPKNIKMTGWVLYINYLLGGPLLDLTQSKIEEYQTVLSIDKLFKIRYDKLVESQRDLINSKYGINSKSLGVVANHFGKKPSSKLLLLKVYFGLIADQMAMSERLREQFDLKVKYINGKFDIGQPISENDEISFVSTNPAQAGKIDKTLVNLQNIEYQACLSFTDAMIGKTKNSSRRKLKGMYIRRILDLFVNPMD